MTSKVFAAAAFMFALPFFVSAQTPLATQPEPPAFLQDIKSEADINTLSPEQKKQLEEFLKNNPPSLSGPETAMPAGTVSCFDNYKFGSVQADLSATLAETVPGATLGFVGTVKNANSYPIVDGQVYVKIFRKGGDASLIHQNGYALVDQFALPETFAIPGNGSKPASFAWKVPENAQSGDYFAAFFFQTAKRYNLLGLSFTDDVTGNQASFSVKNGQDKGVVAFDKHSVTKNGEPHHFAAFLTTFTKTEPVVIRTKLVNPKNETVVVPVIWKLYAWDALREETLKDTKTELIELKPNETRELSYTVLPILSPASYLVVETRDGASKSFLDIRFARDGIEETRINFPSVTSFPLKAGEETSFFSCVHSTNLPIAKDNTLTLTLKDMAGNVIHSYRYQGDITGAMMGVKDTFTPEKTYDAFTLTATLDRGGATQEEVTVTYDCQDIDPSLCSKAPGAAAEAESGLGRGAVMAIVAALVILLLILARTLWRGRGASGGGSYGSGGPRNPRGTHTRTLSFLFALILSGTFLFGGVQGAQAKSVVVSATYSDKLAYYYNYGWGMPSPWLFGLTDFNVNVSYTAVVKNMDAGGIIIPDGSFIPVGTNLQFERIPSVDSDISWFGTGYTSDTPYGRWINGANPPSVSCDSSDLVNSVTLVAGGVAIYTVGVFAPLSINPSTDSISHSGTAGLSCDVSGKNCAVLSPGSISANINFSSTQAKFYYRYKYLSTPTFASFMLNTCWGNNVAMRKATETFLGSGAYSYGTFANVGSSDYVLPVPTQNITFNLTAIGGNSAPTIPTLTPPAPAGTPGLPVSLSATSTDPDGDTLRYGFDWDNNASIDEWGPWSGYVASGTTESVTYTWLAPGTYPIRVFAEDSRGGRSSAATATVTISAAAVNGICGPAAGLTLASAPTLGLCSAGTASPFAGSGPWTWDCLGSGAGTTASCSAFLAPSAPLVDLKINGSDGPLSLASGDMKNISWTSNGLSCTASSSDGFGGVKPPSGSQPLLANLTSDHTLTCANASGLFASDSVQVNVSCTEVIGTYGACDCSTETKSRTNTSAACLPYTETTACTSTEKNNCRDFNWKEVAP